jgi:hypothetical protein
LSISRANFDLFACDLLTSAGRSIAAAAFARIHEAVNVSAQFVTISFATVSSGDIVVNSFGIVLFGKPARQQDSRRSSNNHHPAG